MRLDFFFSCRPGRRWLTWRVAPFRRIVQTVSILLFLFLFLSVCWPYGSVHHTDAMAAREVVPAESFLALDPLVSIATALAARTWVWSLASAGLLLLVCIVFTRGFCGYLCPLGTLLDLFDGAVGRRVTRYRLERRGWWVHLKYYVLTGTLAASLCGVLVAGFVAAIPVLTRGLAFLLGPLQLGLVRGWYLVPPFGAGHILSLVLFALVFALGFLGPRFWCRYVCPTGAVFSLVNLVRVTERRVKADCIGCGACTAVCPFDAIKPDFTTRPAECTFCQTCGGVCPVGAIEFAGRLPRTAEALVPATTGEEPTISRRACAAGIVGAGVAAIGVRTVFGAGLGKAGAPSLVRPPGSVPEQEFLQLCVRCGACFKACPFNVLQPVAFEQGLEGVWTPQVKADWAGCDPTCTNCGRVCPTGAIRSLPLAEKRVARMGCGVVIERTCLPYAGREACELCFDECTAAGYDAIEFLRVGVEVDEAGRPVEDTGFRAPVVREEKCVGCGLCQARCFAMNVKEKRLLGESAIRVEAGPGREDRLRRGSYRSLREEETRRRDEERRKHGGGEGDDYLPDFLK